MRRRLALVVTCAGSSALYCVYGPRAGVFVLEGRLSPTPGVRLDVTVYLTRLSAGTCLRAAVNWQPTSRRLPGTISLVIVQLLLLSLRNASRRRIAARATRKAARREREPVPGAGAGSRISPTTTGPRMTTRRRATGRLRRMILPLPPPTSYRPISSAPIGPRHRPTSRPDRKMSASGARWRRQTGARRRPRPTGRRLRWIDATGR
jgi:hypothetical protein